jgi:predicted O-methyltransferase YrrM
MSQTWAQANQLIESITGFIDPAETIALYNLAKALPDESTILEIGSFKGKSTACLALACIGTSKKVWSIDPFTRQPVKEYREPIWEYSLQTWQDNMKRIGVIDIVNPVIGLSNDIAPSWNKKVDMLFIDGYHKYEFVLADVRNYLPWLKIGGTIAVHDATPSPSPSCP